ncbi:MAG: T9SS type A sorting domain-containing protein [Bacteroidia bacterium]|nr:T9SS type A sorting domain-containing protein [Bacteroidia bacterium]HQV00740.1 T9SS type A sorting domain-containing protein [Bacteroidia bacterium]
MAKRILIFLAASLLALQLPAQTVTTLKVTQFFVGGTAGFPDTIYAGQAYTTSWVITNTGNAPFINAPANPLKILMQADSSFIPYELAATNSLFTLQPGDTVLLTNVDSFPPGVFKLGNNVVVVWPSKNQPIDFIADSTYFYTYYVGLSGIDVTDGAGVLVYPNPFSEMLFMQPLTDGDVSFQLINLTGQVVLAGNHLQQINTSFLRSGLYYLHIRQKQKATRTYKLLKY